MDSHHYPRTDNQVITDMGLIECARESRELICQIQPIRFDGTSWTTQQPFKQQSKRQLKREVKWSHKR